MSPNRAPQVLSRSPLAAAAAALTLALLAACADPAAPAATVRSLAPNAARSDYEHPWAGKTVLLVSGYQNFTTRHCLDVPAFSTSSGQDVQVYPCNQGTNQQWVIDVVPPDINRPTRDRIRFRPVHAPNLCLDVEWGTHTAGLPMQVFTCKSNFGSNQVFRMGPTSIASGFRSPVKIVTENTGFQMGLTVAHPNNEPWVRQQWVGTTSNDYAWSFSQHWFVWDVATNRML